MTSDPPPGVTIIDRSQLLADHIERCLGHRGAVVPTGIGLGRGELVEVRLVATSPVIGRALKDLAPDRWRVSAVFRCDELIVPTGETTLEENDRVLLVGEPELLRGVAEYIRLGTPQFPMPYGSNVVSLEREGVDKKLFHAANRLARSCEPSIRVRALPHLVQQKRDEEKSEESSDEGEEVDAPARMLAFGGFDETERLLHLLESNPGVIVTRPFRRGLWARASGRRGPDAWLCDSTQSPVLFARDEPPPPYRRILLPVSASRLSVEAAEMAIDITRRLGASLTAVNVDLPLYISGQTEEEIHFEMVPIRRLCQLYDVPLEYRHHIGNPVKLILAEAAQHDLVVLARYRRRRDTFFNPDVALRIARKAACSVIVHTSDQGN